MSADTTVSTLLATLWARSNCLRLLKATLPERLAETLADDDTEHGIVHELVVDCLDTLIDELEADADVVRAAVALSADADGLRARHAALLGLIPSPVARDLFGLDVEQLGAAAELAASIDAADD